MQLPDEIFSWNLYISKYKPASATPSCAQKSVLVFGFNPGSTTAASTDIAMIFVNTNLAAAAGAVVAMYTSWIKFGKPEVGMSLNGALAGLVAITAPCANVSPLSAVIIGAVAGALVVMSVLFFDKIKIDPLRFFMTWTIQGFVSVLPSSGRTTCPPTVGAARTCEAKLH